MAMYSISAWARKVAAVFLMIRSMAAGRTLRTSWLKQRVVPSSVTSSQVMFQPVPPASLPIVTTAGSSGAISRLLTDWRFMMIAEAARMASIPWCGIEPWLAFPRTVIFNLSADAMRGPATIDTLPLGRSGQRWSPRIASTSCMIPASSIFNAPRPISSAGWNKNFIVPQNSCRSSEQIFAAPSNMAVCPS